MNKILITGATGFLGNHLLNYMKNIGDDIEIILLTSGVIEGYTCVLHNNYTYSVNDFYRVGVDNIDAIIHLGAYVRKEQKDYSAKKNFATVANTQYLLSHLPNVPNLFLLGSSIDVYGRTHSTEIFNNNIVDSIDESSFPTPMNSYAVVKYLQEELVKEWAEENGVVSHILRLGNQYGIGDQRKFFINTIVQNAVINKPLIYTAHPDMIRNYINVKDTCKFIYNCLSIDEDIGVVNIVSSENRTMLDIIKIISELSGIEYIVQPQEIYYGRNIIFDSTKRERLLGKEKYTLDSGLREYYLNEKTNT